MARNSAHAGFRRTIGLLVALAGAVALTAQLGCKSNHSPTAPPPPPGPDPVPVITGANLTFVVTNPPTADGPPAEILFDGQPIWAGPVVGKVSYGWYHYDTIFSQVLHIEPASLTPGAHTLTFRVSQRRAVAYSLSGWIDLLAAPTRVTRVASWQDQTAWLKTGTEWTYQVVIPASPTG